MSQPIQVNTYTRIPVSKQREFWTAQKIEHLRAIATTARAESLWEDHSESYRILDRIAFANTHPIKSNKEFQSSKNNLSLIKDIDTSVNLAYGRIKLKSPLYLGDMSFGALSGIPNIALARAADITGVLTGTGEGGLNSDVAKTERITVQWASGRFGVDIDVLKLGLGIVIKIGQGAKPGIGGHLPGAKVTEPISIARRIPIGRDAISPAPHHDIYSIEDLGQRIWALKEATGKPVFVKVGNTNYVPYIASGIARMGADGIIMDGGGAGTGASPSVVKDNIGLPIDLTVSSVDRILRDQGLRDGFSVIAAGMVSSAEDTAKLMALGADVVSIGTATLVGLGCLMVHKCHLGFCPAILTNKLVADPAKVLSLDKSVEWTSNLILGWQEELQWILRTLGLRSAKELVGRRDLLRGYRMNNETAGILGIELSRSDVPYISQSPPMKILDNDEYWTNAVRVELQELAGTSGRNPGEAVISSMGSVGPPLVDSPSAVADWLQSDGAQVTRPSIDPYREEIETSCYLADGKIRLSLPMFFGRISVESDKLKEIFARSAFGMGLLFDSEFQKDSSLNSVNRTMLLDGNEYLANPTAEKPAALVVNYLGHDVDLEILPQLKLTGIPIYIRIPSSKKLIQRLDDCLPSEEILTQNHITGLIVDWDLLSDDSRIDIEVATSQIDMLLRERQINDQPLRSYLDLLVIGTRIRGSADIFKLIALGADAVGISKSALIAIGYSPETVEKFDMNKGRQRLENLVLGIQKEIKLLAGAAGISGIQTSLTGNRELLRSIDLDPDIRKMLHVKAGGAP